MPITNEQVAAHEFLADMYRDTYYLQHVVELCKTILVRLCERIEAEQPADLAALYAIAEDATEEFNELESQFDAAGSEIETVGREWIGEEFWFIACAYVFTDADSEELISGRTW